MSQWNEPDDRYSTEPADAQAFTERFDHLYRDWPVPTTSRLRRCHCGEGGSARPCRTFAGRGCWKSFGTGWLLTAMQATSTPTGWTSTSAWSQSQ